MLAGNCGSFCSMVFVGFGAVGEIDKKACFIWKMKHISIRISWKNRYFKQKKNDNLSSSSIIVVG
jgi:hypothetical protein